MQGIYVRDGAIVGAMKTTDTGSKRGYWLENDNTVKSYIVDSNPPTLTRCDHIPHERMHVVLDQFYERLEEQYTLQEKLRERDEIATIIRMVDTLARNPPI